MAEKYQPTYERNWQSVEQRLNAKTEAWTGNVGAQNGSNTLVKAGHKLQIRRSSRQPSRLPHFPSRIQEALTHTAKSSGTLGPVWC